MKLSKIKIYLIILFLFALPLMPLCYLGYSHNTQAEKIINFLHKEKRGVEHLRDLYDIYFQAFDRNQSSEKLKLLQDRIEKIKKEILSEQVYGPDVFKQPKISSLIALNISSGKETFLSDLLHVVSSIIENSNLILDGELETYYLMDALYIKFPRLLKYSENVNSSQNNNKLFQRDLFDEFVSEFEKLKSSVCKSTVFHRKKGNGDNELKLLGDIVNVKMKISSENRAESIASFNKYKDQFLDVGSATISKLITLRIKQEEIIKNKSLFRTFVLVLICIIIASLIMRYLWDWRASYITEIALQQQAIEKGLRLATVGEIFASVGHDIANPLQVIDMCAERLKRIFENIEFSESKKVKELLTKIIKMNLHAETIIKNMKVLLKETSDFEYQEFDLNSLISDLQDLTQYRAAHNNVQIVFQNNCKDIVIYSNPFAIMQILTNLVNNAIDALKTSPEKNIIIRSELKEKYLQICVHDSGPGVPAEHHDKIFQTLFTTKHSTGGTGLGLSSSRKIAERLHSTLVLEKTDKGACFALRIPQTAIISKSQ